MNDEAATYYEDIID